MTLILHNRDKDESIRLEKDKKREIDEALKDRKKYCLYPSGLMKQVGSVIKTPR